MAEPRKLGWGILGAARMAATMLPSLLQAKNAKLVAVASRRPGAAAELVAKSAPHLSGVKTFDHPEQLLQDPEVEAIYLPMANEEHAAWALAGVKHQKHVLVEKPLALSETDVQAIRQAAQAKRVKVMEGFMYRFHPQHERVQEILRSGTIGELRTVRTCFSFLMTPQRLYRISRPIEQGGGALWDIGCYAVHTARMFFPHPPKAVLALAKFNAHGADVSACGALDFGDGRYALFDFSYERARRAEYELIGTLGGVKCHNVWAKPGEVPIISWWTEKGERREEQLPPADHFRLEIEHFSHCVLNDLEPALSLEDAQINCRVLERTLQAIREKRSISLET
nr:Gfo/Idh/MocA family oxidoreductase [uncultured Gammaproteobacteria bacterium]BAL54519.1 Gfo/Idh/MocA family oxidoreductase [uncultured Gammaproteobacteria bacterium]